MEFLADHHNLVILWRLINAVGLFLAALGFIAVLLRHPGVSRSRAQRARYVALVLVLMALALDVAEQVWLDAVLGTRSIANTVALGAAVYALVLTWRRRADG